MTDTAARWVTVGIWFVPLTLAGWRLGALGGAAAERDRAARFAARVGLPGDVGPGLVRRVVRRQRFVLAGVALGVVAMLAAGGSVALIWAGLAVGALADQLASPAAPDGAPRVAHTAGTRLTDYVPGWLLGAVLAAFACVPALALLWLVAPRGGVLADVPGTSGAEVAGLVAVAVAGLAGSLALAAFLVRRRQRAASAAGLATDDAFRAQAVRDALHLTTAMSLAVAFGLSLALQDPAVQGVARVVGGWTPIVLLLGLIAVGVVHEATGGPRHWRRRLPAEPAAP
jgi:hypothetical protein